MSNAVAIMAITISFVGLSLIAKVEFQPALIAGAGVALCCAIVVAITERIDYVRKREAAHRAAMIEQAQMRDAFNQAYFYYHYVLHG